MLIYEVRDLWPLSQIEVGGMSPWHPFVVLLQRAENYAYRHADRVVSTLPVRRGASAAARAGGGPLHVHPQRHRRGPVAEPAVAPARASTPGPGVLQAQGRFLVGYAGMHGLANSLDSLVDAAAILKEQPLAFVLVGQGWRKSDCRRRRDNWA